MGCLVKITLFIYALAVLLLVGERFVTAREGMLIESVIVRVNDDSDANLYRLSLATLRMRRIGQASSSPLPPQITPDYQWLIHPLSPENSGNVDIFRVHLGRYTSERLTDDAAFDYAPTLSADGNWIFYQADGDLYRMRLDGSDKQRLTELPLRKSILTLSADGQWLFFSVHDLHSDTIQRVRTDGTTLEPLLSMTYLYDLIPSPDGQWLYFSGILNREFDIFRMRVDGTALENLTQTPTNDYLMHVTPDAVLYLAKQSDDLEIHRMQLASRTAEILNPAETWTGMVQVTPDKEWVVYRAGLYAPEIYRMRVDGSERLNLSQSLANDDMPYLSPDGHTIFFISDRTGHYELYQVDLTGVGLRQLTNADAYVCCPIAVPLATTSYHTGRLLGLALVLLASIALQARKKPLSEMEGFLLVQ